MIEALGDSLKYKRWIADLEKNKIELINVEELSTVRKPNGEVLFSMIRLDARAADGQKLLPIAFIRGHFVSVLTILTAAESGERYLLLVRQRRVSTGDWFYEHPAGMCDSESDPAKVALKEVAEETGLQLTLSQLVALNQEPYYTSPGVSDEGGYFFYCELTLPAAEIASFQEKNRGDNTENEYIITCAVPIKEAIGLLKNVASLANWYLYLAHKQLLPV